MTYEAGTHRWKVFASTCKTRIIERCRILQAGILWTLCHQKEDQGEIRHNNSLNQGESGLCSHRCLVREKKGKLGVVSTIPTHFTSHVDAAYDVQSVMLTQSFWCTARAVCVHAIHLKTTVEKSRYLSIFQNPHVIWQFHVDVCLLSFIDFFWVKSRKSTSFINEKIMKL